jgi:hypothetical protein
MVVADVALDLERLRGEEAEIAHEQPFGKEEPPFRQKWLETTTGRYVRMSTLVSVELLALDPDDPRLTS